MPSVKKGHNTFNINRDENISELCADEMKLKQALYNLINNACKFTENGTIDINIFRNTEDNKEWINFKVTDSGIGIEKNKIKTLFNSFTQASSSITRLYGGTGLGLAISKHFIEKMGGNIKVESIFGEGSTFILKLPFSNLKCKNT
jgi:signal transduction histidine kinase